MKNKSMSKSLLVSSLSVLALASSAHAALTVTFSESGSDVIGVLSGSLVLPTGTTGTGSVAAQYGNSTAFGTLISGQTWLRFNGNTATASGLTTGATSFTGTQIFAWGAGDLYVDNPSANGSTYTPTGTWTYAGQTLDTLFTGVNAPTLHVPKVVYTLGDSGDTVSFVTVPEPSSTALLGLGGLALILRRRK